MVSSPQPGTRSEEAMPLKELESFRAAFARLPEGYR